MLPEQDDIRTGYGVQCPLIKLILHLTELCDPCAHIFFTLHGSEVRGSRVVRPRSSVQADEIHGDHSVLRK